MKYQNQSVPSPHTFHVQLHRSHDILLTFVTEEPKTAAAIALEAVGANVTIQQATRILTAATQRGAILSKRDPSGYVGSRRQVYYRKTV